MCSKICIKSLAGSVCLRAFPNSKDFALGIASRGAAVVEAMLKKDALRIALRI
jgi:hypothetical protein